ncbi:MAG: ribose-5-phosphate isomerase RpiA [Candidatus Micrarchaeota archaeon]|nr:ribose-5-phosphate isomerase RpiA [Candidatus Micrarchaeota archaeon]MBU1682210.1 ribose-5-phosphate isomerase RpiA [Candidatus Micrarchaeota archaeon]
MNLSKINAAKAALDYVKDGMCIGLGSGSTVKEFIRLLGEKVKAGLKITCVTTSFDSRMLAAENGISVTEPDSIGEIDLAVDGADKVTKTALLKGGGGALTREKIVDYNAKRFIVIVDESKVIEGQLEGDVNLEVLPFAAPLIMRKLKQYNPKIRMSKAKLGPVISDNGCFIIDCNMMKIENPKELERELKNMPGIIENGIFTQFDQIIVGNENGFRIL